MSSFDSWAGGYAAVSSEPSLGLECPAFDDDSVLTTALDLGMPWRQVPGFQSFAMDAQNIPSAMSPQPDTQASSGWDKNYSKVINGNVGGRYFEYFGEGFSKVKTSSTVNFIVDVNLAGGRVDIVLPLQYVESALPIKLKSSIQPYLPFELSFPRHAVDSMNVGIDEHLNNKLQAQVTDPLYGSKRLDINYSVLWGEGPEFKKFTVADELPGGQAAFIDRGGNLLVDTDFARPGILARQYSYAVGQPAECEKVDKKYVRYIMPDQTSGSILKMKPSSVCSNLFGYDPEFNPPSQRIMALDFQVAERVQPQNAWGIGMEVQDMLTEALKRPIQVTILPVGEPGSR